ncbi:thiosulfate-binding protein SoxY [Rubellimicrobium thermophilum DSM 16684]|uniref:Thiosulfate-binding protein SoxY n=1 Tax=Rubellimicrobium thermophilum DSM 16684 TaxID=1123069 RepID=S9SEW8_9RHOB|nr:thiosulfate oxidation carrier protein SoxY [Rubellimicrobium thermophilum]EPX84834.1 thiosulfate-binding protein SoxY [Rubellimicrobium thermophilum DSM 16684]
MTHTRRETLLIGLGAFAAATGLAGPSLAATLEERIDAFTGGAAMAEGGITLTAPEIAENGNTVPISVEAPGAVAIMLLASGNPNPDVGTFHFGPLAASQRAATRIRLAATQEVIAIAQMADGSFLRTSREVKVTIGGCGG